MIGKPGHPVSSIMAGAGGIRTGTAHPEPVKPGLIDMNATLGAMPISNQHRRSLLMLWIYYPYETRSDTPSMRRTGKPSASLR